MSRLQISERNDRPMDNVQYPAMPVLHGPLDSAHWQTENTDQRRNFCTEACRFGRCNRLGARRGIDTQAGEGSAVHSAMTRLFERECADYVKAAE